MVRALLAERFGLKVRRETREGSVFNLVVAKGDPKFRPSTTPPEQRLAGGGMGSFSATGVTLEFFLQRLSAQPERPIDDRTGLNGQCDIEMHWTPQKLSASAQMVGEPPSGADDPALTAALEEQLGLKLERTRGPIETLVVEAVERPGQN